jgi:hypothetical protein
VDPQQAHIRRGAAKLRQRCAVLICRAPDLAGCRPALDQPLQFAKPPVGQVQPQIGLPLLAAQARVQLLEVALERVERIAGETLGGRVARP